MEARTIEVVADCLTATWLVDGRVVFLCQPLRSGLTEGLSAPIMTQEYMSAVRGSRRRLHRIHTASRPTRDVWAIARFVRLPADQDRRPLRGDLQR